MQRLTFRGGGSFVEKQIKMSQLLCKISGEEISNRCVWTNDSRYLLPSEFFLSPYDYLSIRDVDRIWRGIREETHNQTNRNSNICRSVQSRGRPGFIFNVFYVHAFITL